METVYARSHENQKDEERDNINANDQVYNQVFPYSATPHAGPTNRKDPQ